MVSKTFFRLALILFFLNNLTDIWPTTAFEAYVIANDGAILRETPNLSGKIVTKLPYGQALIVLQELKESVTITLKDLPYSGVWLYVQSAQNKGYIFSALVSPKIADDFTCDKTDFGKNTEIFHRDVQIELCADGSYYLDEGYDCKGTCSTHGCWRLKDNVVQLSKRKQFRVQGVGKPVHCTHFCVYEKYRVETTVWASQPYVESPVQMTDLKALIYKGVTKMPDIRFSPASPACRRSYLFNKPR